MRCHFKGINRGASANKLLNTGGAKVRVSIYCTNTVVSTAEGSFIFIKRRKERVGGVSSCGGGDRSDVEGGRGVGDIEDSGGGNTKEDNTEFIMRL